MIYTANELKKLEQGKQKQELIYVIKRFKQQLSVKLSKAVYSHIKTIEMDIPQGIDSSTKHQVVSSIRKLGYTVSMSRKEGYISDNLYVGPKTVLTISWA